jgi:F-type H+-transporting ATPase subunit gamma
MASIREMRLRISSIKNLAQVTRALETVSASKVRRAIQANEQTKPYSEKAWQILVHLANQPGRSSLHPLLAERNQIDRDLVILISSDRGLAGAYNVNIVRHTLVEMKSHDVEVTYITVGRKGRDMLLRRRRPILAEFTGLAATPTFAECAPIGKMAVDEYLAGNYDAIFIAYTEFVNMLQQTPVIRQLLPLDPLKMVVEGHLSEADQNSNGVITYEPDPEELLNQIVPRFTTLQVYQAILSAQASEHAARMVSMRNATESAKDLISILQLEYNKARQASITSDMLDISGGAEALAQASAGKV